MIGEGEEMVNQYLRGLAVDMQEEPDVPGRLRAFADLYERLVTMLEKLEWAAIDEESGEADCPMCGRAHTVGHYSNCVLAAILKEVKGE